MDFGDEFGSSYSSYDEYCSYDPDPMFYDPNNYDDYSQSPPSNDTEVPDSNYKVADNDPSIIFNNNISQAKTFIRERLNIPISSPFLTLCHA